MLPLIAALLSVIGISQAQIITPTGPVVNLQAQLANGATYYVQNALNNLYTFTDNQNSATVFTLDPTTGFFYQATTNTAQFPSGYIVPAVTASGVLSLLDLVGYDGLVVQGNNYSPLACTGSINLLGLAQPTVPLLCSNNILSTLVQGFGICPARNNDIVNFGLLGIASFLLACPSQPLAGDALQIVQFNAVLAPNQPTNPTNTLTNPNGGLTTVLPSQGTCSVTVSILVTTTTVFVPAPYTGPATSGSGGSTTGPNPYGCQPITSIIGLG